MDAEVLLHAPFREGRVRCNQAHRVRQHESPAPPANDDRRPETKPVIATTGRKRYSVTDRAHLPMDLPLSRKPVEREGDDYKRLRAAMARRLRGVDE